MIKRILNTIGLVFVYIIIPITRPLVNIKTIIWESTIFKDIITDYKNETKRYRELSKHNFDSTKLYEAKKEALIKEVMKNTH